MQFVVNGCPKENVINVHHILYYRAAVNLVASGRDTAGDGTHQMAAQTVRKLQISHLSNLHCP